MAVNYETLSDFEVATAEDAQNLFMDQAVVKVDTDADLASLPTTVKTAYVLNTGVLMARDVANVWKPQGGSATVSETAPSDPQVGALWVKPSEVLPLPVVGSLGGSTGAPITATSYAQVPTTTTQAFTTTKAVMCMVAFNSWSNPDTASMRLALEFTGATTGTSEDKVGLAGTVYATTGSDRATRGATFAMVFPAGTTTVKIVGFKSGTGSPTSTNTGLSIVPVQWADAYEAGV